MEAVETRRKQGRISISEKKLQAVLCMVLNSKLSQNIFETNINSDWNKIFKMAQTIQNTYKDATGEECSSDDKGNLTISDEAKLHAWKEHYQRL